LAKSRAEVTWNGNLFQGSGTARSESGVIPEVPVSWASRIERTKGKTSPEELIAMAHASCFAMALSNTLDKAGSPPTRLEITAVVAFEKVGEGNKITTSELEVRGEVPGLDQARFEELARQGEQGCPVSNALRNNVQISVKAELLGG
jgi:lipoyl-dependent peroxiredoxin